MKTSEIQEFVSQLRETDKPKAILIDGPWGCGKTTQSLKCLINLEAGGRKGKGTNPVIKREIYYISVFGFSSIDEIRSAIERAEHEKAKKIGEKAISVFRMVTPYISKAVSAVVPLPGVVRDIIEKAPDAAEALLESFAKGQKRNVIIVIDDIERLKTGFLLIDVLGFVEQLKSYGNNVLCLGNSEQIKDEDDKRVWNDFKEKCFDRECKIDQTEDAIITQITGATDKQTIQSISKIIDNNYRIAERGVLLKNDVEKAIETLLAPGAEKKYTSDGLLIDCTICCRCLSGDDKKKFISHIAAIDTATNKTEESEWQQNKKLFGEKAANNLSHYLHNGQENMGQANGSFLTAIMSFSYYNRKSGLNKLLKYPEKEEEQKKESEDAPLHPFFYSDEKRQEFKKAFLDSVKNKTILESEDLGLQDFTNMLSLSKDFLTEAEIDLYFDTIMDKAIDSDDVKRRLDHLAIFEKTGKMAAYYKKVQETEKKHKDLKRAERIATLKASAGYKKMCDFLQELEWSKQRGETIEATVNELEKGNFLLPDITGDITVDMWSYVHDICNLAEKGILSKQNVLKELKKQLLTHKTTCGQERIESLTHQYQLDQQ